MTFLFTDIEGSTALWEHDGARMSQALAAHDALARCAVEGNRGTVVKMIGDGMHAVFEDALDAVAATVKMQQALIDPSATNGIPLRVRCGLHAGVGERRDNDYFGNPVNRAARIMNAAHGGQVLLSQVVVDGVRERLPATVALRDLGKVRLRDLSTPEHIYQIVHPELRQEFPALRSLEATPNNLPQQVTTFIGRERELAELKRLLVRTRLLTLTGSGGCGKTRLCLQGAADCLERFPDGVWLVELAPLADERLLPQSVVTVLGLMEEPGISIVQTLIEHLKDKRLLLLLDNCEHLIDGCAQLVDTLIRQCPKITILASSREALGIGGEQAYRVPSLSLPDPKQAHTPISIAPFEAVQLFTDRAQLSRADFKVTTQNAPRLASICYRLDGIPLAIELAAARVSSLSVEEINSKLDQCFRLLTVGSRTALPRHQTLRATIDWSYDLLAPAERALLVRLAVFAGGFTLDGAEAVGVGGDVADMDVLDLLGQLVGKSLVALDVNHDRYHLLETVRQYALERLAQSDAEDQSRVKHLRYYVSLAQQAETGLSGPEQRSWHARLDSERENILLAHAYCRVAQGGGEAGLKLIHALRRWVGRNNFQLWNRVCREVLAHPEAQQESLDRSHALYVASFVGRMAGRYDEARAWAEEGLRIAQKCGDTLAIWDARFQLGNALLGLDRTAALGHFVQVLAIAREVGDPRRLAFASTGLGEAYAMAGKLELAEPHYIEALALYRTQGDQGGIALGLFNLSRISIARGALAKGSQVPA